MLNLEPTFYAIFFQALKWYSFFCIFVENDLESKLIRHFVVEKFCVFHTLTNKTFTLNCFFWICTRIANLLSMNFSQNDKIRCSNWIKINNFLFSFDSKLQACLLNRPYLQSYQTLTWSSPRSCLDLFK